MGCEVKQRFAMLRHRNKVSQRFFSARRNAKSGDLELRSKKKWQKSFLRKKLYFAVFSCSVTPKLHFSRCGEHLKTVATLCSTQYCKSLFDFAQSAFSATYMRCVVILLHQYAMNSMFLISLTDLYFFLEFARGGS